MAVIMDKFEGDRRPLDKAERAKRLRYSLSQIAGIVQDLESIASGSVEPEELGVLESLGVPRKNLDAIKSGLEKLADNREDITPDEAFGLEAIVMKANRPVAFVRSNSYDDLDDPWRSLNSAEVRTRLSALFPLIGRIELPTSPILPYAGTGFVVGNGLVMTNRHVAQVFSQGLGLSIRYRAGDAAIDLKRQVDTPEGDHSAYFAVRAVEMIHPYWDMALLRVDGLAAYKMLRLSVRSPEELIGRNIVAIGYPARDPRTESHIHDVIFGAIYNVKRLQPGIVRGRAKVRSFGNLVNAMTHDASTLGGNAGSPVIDVETGEVIALHFAGEYLEANYAVPMYELARDSRVAPKLNFDGTVAATSDFDPGWRSISAEAAPATALATQPHQASVSLQSMDIALGAERSLKPKYFVSYAWADSTDPDREKIVDQACEEAERRGLTIIRDKTTLKVGDSISEFMSRIARGDVIFVVLSDKYLKSAYCMFEMFDIWRVNRQDKDEFRKQVRVYILPDAKIFTPIDRIEYAEYWGNQIDLLKQAVKRAGWEVLGEEDLRTYRLMQDFYNKVSDILALFANILQPRTFDDLKKYGFGEPAPATTPAERRLD